MIKSRVKLKENEDPTVIEIHVLSNLQFPMNKVSVFPGLYRVAEQFVVMASQWKTKEIWFRR
jgi:hypothetical protein